MENNPFARLRQAALAAVCRDGDSAAVTALFRLACVAAAAFGLCGLGPTKACSPVPPPSPPPQAAAESDSQFAARSDEWYRDLYEREWEAGRPGRIAHEQRLWATAGRVVLARIAKVGSIRLRGSEGQLYRSPLVTLRAVEWLKGKPSRVALKVHYLSDDSCDHGGGDVIGGAVGDRFLLFYRPGPIDPRNVIETLGRRRASTTPSLDALTLARFIRAAPSGGRTASHGRPLRQSD